MLDPLVSAEDLVGKLERDKCSHTPCTCKVAPGVAYCNAPREAVAKTPDIKWRCAVVIRLANTEATNSTHTSIISIGAAAFMRKVEIKTASKARAAGT
jgi:hypothetical protein